MTDPCTIDTRVAEEAADWLLRLQEGALDHRDRAAFDEWRARSSMHASAWQRAERLMTFSDTAPAGVARDAMGRLRKLDRRQALQAVAVLLVAAPAAWQAARRAPAWSADLRTAKGERRSLPLPDGTTLALNSASAVDIRFDTSERRLRLHEGEILVTTRPDPTVPARPFRVTTAQGSVLALGTRFSVRQLDGSTHVAVFEHAVKIHGRRAGMRVLQAGEQARFSAASIGEPAPVLATATAWESGFYVANRLRLRELVGELSRHRSGILRCDPAVADMRVSGTFPIGNDDRALSLLQNSLPVSIETRSRYWVTIRPR